MKLLKNQRPAGFGSGGRGLTLAIFTQMTRVRAPASPDRPFWPSSQVPTKSQKTREVVNMRELVTVSPPPKTIIIGLGCLRLAVVVGGVVWL